MEVKRVGEKENEISCLPEYLKMFDLKDTIVTIDAIGSNNIVIKAVEKGGGNYAVPVKENQKRLLQTINSEIKRLETSGEIKELDKAEKITKEHGRVETVSMRMIDNTAFLYEELGMALFFGSIARIGIMDKKVYREQRRKRGDKRKPGGHNNGCGKYERGEYLKNKSGSLKYRNAALASGHTVKGRCQNSKKRECDNEWGNLKKIMYDGKEAQ